MSNPNYKEEQRKAKEQPIDIILCQYCGKPVTFRIKGKNGRFTSPFVKASDKAYVHKCHLAEYERQLSIKEVKE